MLCCLSLMENMYVRHHPYLMKVRNHRNNAIFLFAEKLNYCRELLKGINIVLLIIVESLRQGWLRYGRGLRLLTIHLL